MNKHYDIAIVGGGMVGLACALALAKTSLRIAVVETKRPNFVDSTDYDLRVSAINIASIKFFKTIGVWPSILQQRISPFTNMHVWADNSKLDFSASAINEPELGFIIENKVIRQALWQKSEAQNNIDILCPMSLQSVTINKQVQLVSEQQTINCDLIIGADGANSWLRQQVDWPMNNKDYQHHALVTTVKTSLPHQQTAWQHFLNDGPLAFLPLSDPHFCSIVWSSPAEKIARLKEKSEQEFNQAITTAMQKTLGQVQTIAPKVSFPLSMQHLQNYVADHIAFIGDAAHRIHPLAGQGVNLGFMDAQCLAHTISHAIEKKKAFATTKTLAAYQRERKYYNGQMITLMQGIKDIFACQTPMLSSLRNIGINTLNKVPLAKNFLIKQALGL